MDVNKEIEERTYNAVRHFDNLHDVWDHVYSMIGGEVGYNTPAYHEAKAKCEKEAKSYGIHD